MVSSGVLGENAIDFINSVIQKYGVYVFACVFNADINAINTSNTQLGFVYPPCYVGYKYDGTPDDAPYEMYYILNYTIEDQHKIKNLYLYSLSHDIPIENLEDTQSASSPVSFPWPVGLTNGYKYYLTYQNHTTYWDGLMQYVWNTYDYIRNNFNNDYGKYAQNFKSYLQQLINKLETKSALKSLSSFPLKFS